MRLEEVSVPKVGPNDALLRVRATGVGLTVVIMTAVPGRVTAFPVRQILATRRPAAPGPPARGARHGQLSSPD